MDITIKYRITKDELYNFIVYEISKNKTRKLQFMFLDMTIVICIMVFIILLIDANNIEVSLLLKSAIIIGILIVTLPRIVRLKGMLFKYAIKTSYEAEFENMCDKDTYIFLDKNKIIIRRNDNELISSLKNPYIKINPNYNTQIVLDIFSKKFFIPYAAFNSVEQREEFINLLKKYNEES